MADGTGGLRSTLPAGMRNNNPGNIKYLPTLPYAGVVGPSRNTDQGDPQAVFETPEAGMSAAYQLALKKYLNGKTTANSLIAGRGGWTPGNRSAAANIAGLAGVGPDDDLNLTDPDRATAFLRGLLRQEHGRASDAYSDDMIRSAISGGSGQTTLRGGVTAEPPKNKAAALGITKQEAIEELLARGDITPEKAASLGYVAPAAAAAEEGDSPSILGEFGRQFIDPIERVPGQIIQGVASPVGALGYPETAESMRAAGRGVETALAGEAAPPMAVPTMADIDGPMSALKYGAGKAGQVLGGTALPVIAGVGAGLVGGPAAGAAAAAAVGYPLAVQQTAADLAAQGVPNDTIASITGIPIAALDTLGLGAAGALGGRAASKLVGGVVGDALAARLGSSVAGRAVRGAAAEAPTEFTQQAVQEAAGRVAGGDRPLSEMLGNSLEAGALGAVGGGILGPIFHHGRHVENPAAETPPADAAPAEPAPLALPAPDHADPIIQPLVAEHNDLRVRAQELQAKVAANPGATPDAIRLQNVQARMGQIAQQIQQVRQSAITPAAAPVDSAIPTQIAPAGISRPVEPTPDWTQAQPGEVAIPIEENGQQIGGHVFLRDDGTARIPGVAPNVGLPSPLSQLPDRVPTPAEVLEAANVPQGPKVVSGAVVDAQLTGAIDTARQKRQQERIDRQKAIQEQAQKDAADLQRWTEQVRVARQAAPDDAGSLLQFVRSHGGINRNAEGGQDVIATMARSYSGQDGRRLRGVTVGTGGNTVEDMAMRAWQAGYVGGEERPTIQDFLDALEKDGRKGGVYPEAEQDRRAVLEAQQVGARGAMDAAGVLVTDTPKQAARKLVAWERAQAETPETALPEATNENVEPPPARAAIGADDDIPFRKQELPPLADDEVEMPRSTATAAQRAEAETRVRRIAREMFGPQVNVAASDSIGTNRGEFAHGMYEAPEPGSAAGVIHVAMRAANTPISDRDQLRTVYHEGIHHLRHMKAFKPAEWKVLADKAAKEWKAKHKIEELYPDASPDLKTEEAIAEAFADWRAGQDQGPKVNGIFARIQRLFSRVAQAARGLGFKTADDIFSDVSKGRTAKRIRPDVAQEESPERKFSLKPPPNSIPTPEENVQRGKAALDEAYRTGQDSYNAMYRKDLLGGNDGDTGWIDFLNGDRKLGLEHMFEGRENNPKDDPPLVGKDFTKFINNIPDTIQNGQLHGWYEERGDIRRNITRNNQTVVLQFNHDNGRSTWIATVRPGYTKKALNGRFISPAEAQRLINKAIGKDTAGASGRVTGSVSGATRGANQTSPTSNTPREAGTANRPGRSPISGAAGAAVRENVPNKVQPVKPKTGPYRLRPATAPAPTPTTIREALNEGESYGKVRESIAKAIGLVKPGAKPGDIGRSMDTFRRTVQDFFLPVMRTQQALEKMGRSVADDQNVYVSQEGMSGRVTDRTERLAREHITPILDAISRNKLTAKEVEDYFMARHAPERNAHISRINPKFAPGTGSGMTDAEAAQIMAGFRANGKLAQLDRVAPLVDRMRRETLQGLVRDGLMAPELAAHLEQTYQFYVPLKGNPNGDPMEDVLPNVQGGIQVRGDESKRAFGRQSRASDVLENLIMQAQEGIIRGEKNRVVGSLVNLVEANPDADFWSVNPATVKPIFNKTTGQVEYRNQAQQEDAKTIWGKVGGKPVRVRIEDPRLARALKNLDAERMGSAVRFLAGINRFLSTLNTSWSPEFVVSNAFRDLIQANVIGQKYDIPKFTKMMRKNYFKALKGAYGGLSGKEATEYQKLFQQFSKLGGRVGFAQMESLQDIRARLARELKNREGGAGSMPRRAMQTMGEFISRTNGAVDNAIRLAAFKAALDSGMTPQQAASVGKNITVNFNRHGNIGPLANAFYMFFNAGVQGNQVLLSAIKGSRKVQKIMGAIVAAGAAQEIGNRLFGGQDDDGDDLYDKIGGNTDASDYLKSTNMVFMIPGAGKEDWNYIRIPLPYGLNVFWNMGRNAAAMAMGKQSAARTLGNIGTSALDAFNPVGGADNLINLMAPSLMDPIVDIYLNQNFAGAPVMPEKNDPNLPQSSKGQYWASASGPSVWMSHTLNEITGGNEFKPGIVNWNPNAVDHAFGSYAGAAGGLAGRLFSAAQRGLGLNDDPTQPVMSKSEVPFVRRIAGGTSRGFDRSEFYERNEQLQQLKNQIDGYAESGDRETSVRIRQQNKALVPLIAQGERVQKDLATLRKQKSVILDSDTLTREAKAKRLEAIQTQEQKILLQFNTRWVKANKEAA